MTAPANSNPSARKAWPLPDRLREAIRRRAEEIYIRGGKKPGRDLENWAQAEEEIVAEWATLHSHRPSIVVNVNGVEYFGEYDPGSAVGYVPGEFGPGDLIPVRFEGEKMFVTRPNGRELETAIVKRIG
jgi:Protein of unknown function (DUF2934)